MPRFRLRYQAIDVDLKKGDFTVGRNPDCDLVLDDARVSRRHAIFRVSEDLIVVEDLGSRNGVRVNDRKIADATPLKHGDRTRIGSQELTLQDASERKGAGKSDMNTRTVKIRVCQTCALPIEFDTEVCPHCNTSKDSTTSGGDESTEAAAGRRVRSKGQFTTSSINLITNIADKALSMGQHDEAERLVTGILTNVLSEVERGQSIDDSEVNVTTQYALRIAVATLKPRWVDSVFELYTATGRLMPAETIDSLYSLFNTLRYSNTVPLRSYLALLRAQADSYGPSDRFLLQRIEGLERLALSK